MHARVLASLPIGVFQKELLSSPSFHVAELVDCIAASDLTKALFLTVEPPIDVGLAVIAQRGSHEVDVLERCAFIRTVRVTHVGVLAWADHFDVCIVAGFGVLHADPGLSTCVGLKIDLLLLARIPQGDTADRFV